MESNKVIEASEDEVEKHLDLFNEPLAGRRDQNDEASSVGSLPYHLPNVSSNVKDIG